MSTSPQENLNGLQQRAESVPTPTEQIEELDPCIRGRIESAMRCFKECIEALLTIESPRLRIQAMALLTGLMISLLLAQKAEGQEVRLSDKTRFQAKAKGGLFVTGNREEGGQLPARGRKSDAGTLGGELSGYYVLGENDERTEYLLGLTGGYEKTSDNDGVVPGDLQPRTLDYELAYGALSLALLNQDAKILRGRVQLDLGAAFRDLFAEEVLAYARGRAEGELSIAKPFGIYAGASGLLLEGKNERYRREGRLDLGIQLYQDFEDPNVLHFRFAKLGGFVSLGHERDEETGVNISRDSQISGPARYIEKRFKVGFRGEVDFGTVVVRFDIAVPGSRRRVREADGDVERKSDDGNARPLEIVGAITFRF